MPETKLNEREVSWTANEVSIYGTLTLPDGEGTFPAVVFVAGSGPTDRNWNTPLLPGSNGSAGLLAEALTRLGFVTLRYDKGASGVHAQENMHKLAGKISLQGHMNELAGAVDLVADRPDVRDDQIFVLGNSEGCVHALNYQVYGNRPCAGLVLTAPPARPIGQVAHDQLKAQLDAVPGGDEILSKYDAVIADFIGESPVEIPNDLPKGLQDMLRSVTVPFNQPFSRELWTLDPMRLLEQVTAPVLIVIGKKDIQVDWQVDGALLEAAAKRMENVQIEFPEEANHVLKHETRPRAELTPAAVQDSYNGPDTRLDPQALQVIESWLQEHLKTG